MNRHPIGLAGRVGISYSFSIFVTLVPSKDT
jgi:hypothetical protein